MASQAAALYHLQEIDLQIMHNRKRLKEIAGLLEDNQAVKDAQERVDAAENELRPLRAHVRDLELESQSNSQKADDAEQRLYSGEIKNPKEMQELQQEIDALRRRNIELEERLIENISTAERIESDLTEFQIALETIQSTAQTTRAELLVEQKAVAVATQELKAKREHAIVGIPPESLELYENLRPKKSGRPIAILKDGSDCSVCGFEQTTTVAREAQLGQRLVSCINCGRILASV
ncbi:MAG: C4-type zinc ribbon domain-containing protein [Anaerolineae bacterium]